MEMTGPRVLNPDKLRRHLKCKYILPFEWNSEVDEA